MLTPQPPRIRIRVQSDDEPDAYPRNSEWWDAKDAAAMRAGRVELYVIEILDGAGRVLDKSNNYLALPGCTGVYDRPDDIREIWLAYYAADSWTYQFGIQPGDLVREGGHVLAVIDYEQDDQGGPASGFLICQDTRTGLRRLVWIEHARPVLALTTPRCSTVGCRDWATHLLHTDNPDPLPDEDEREREPVCEPCGTSYVNTNRIKRLNGALTKGTV